MTTERETQAAIITKLNRGPTRLFRNNVGQLVDAQGKHVRYGVCNPGGSDLIGWHSVTVTPDMVGSKVAVFLAVEVKGPKGRATKEQLAFVDAVNRAGGLARVCRSDEEACSLIGVDSGSSDQ